MREDVFIPSVFCWTRFGTEAGETIGAILERKEHERNMNKGVYFWGIGNSVSRALVELLQRTSSPEVLFSPIKSRPRGIDVKPRALVRWHGGIAPNGRRIVVPQTARIVSGLSTRSHYALVCASRDPLRLADLGRLTIGSLRNLLSGNQLGSSQVTAVVERLAHCDSGTEYVIALRARLVAPYFVRLVDPVIERLERLTDPAQAA
jgi:hypothetical protein